MCIVLTKSYSLNYFIVNNSVDVSEVLLEQAVEGTSGTVSEVLLEQAVEGTSGTQKRI